MSVLVDTQVYVPADTPCLWRGSDPTFVRAIKALLYPLDVDDDADVQIGHSGASTWIVVGEITSSRPL